MSFNFGYPHQVYALPARSLRSLGVAIPPSARKLAAGYRPYGALARMPALGYASGTLRSACAAVGPPRRRQPGGYGVVAGVPIAIGVVTGMPLQRLEKRFPEEENECPNPSIRKEKDSRYGLCPPIPMVRGASAP